MSGLVKINDGQWVRPQSVVRIEVFKVKDSEKASLLDRFRSKPDPYRIYVTYDDDRQTSWTLASWDEACDEAGRIAKLVNAVPTAFTPKVVA